MNTHIHRTLYSLMGWLQLVGSIKLKVSFAKEPYKRDYILQKRPITLSILLSVATPYIKINFVEVPQMPQRHRIQTIVCSVKNKLLERGTGL